MELILNTFGVSLTRENDGFIVISNGEKQRVPTDGIRSIHISKGAQITSDAVMLAIENEIDILFVDRAGNPFGRVWSPRYGSISTIRKGQINFLHGTDAVEWIKDIIEKKIANQQSLLFALQPEDGSLSNLVSTTVTRLEAYRTKVLGIYGLTIADVASSLRGWEGSASRIYFETLNAMIPEEYRFVARSQHPATDIANALLNYGYGILYGKIEGALIKAGIDPYIGVLHRDVYNRPVLVYDVIELYRVWVDYVVFSLLKQKVITEEFYSMSDDGSCWLEKLGRRILIQSVTDYLEETVTINKLHRSRLSHIDLYSQNLAQFLKTFEP